MIRTILGILSSVITIYTILCFLNIILSWLPGARYTKFGRMIYSFTEPYMSFFSRSGLLRIGNVDFSPIISIGILSLCSSILAGIISTGKIYFGSVLATIVYMLWNISSSILGFFLLIIFIRLLFLLISRGRVSQDSFWTHIDYSLSRLTYKVAGTFYKGNISYRTSLLITCLSFLVILVAGNVLVRLLIGLCYRLPF